jgi:hypothetical protein
MSDKALNGENEPGEKDDSDLEYGQNRETEYTESYDDYLYF